MREVFIHQRTITNRADALDMNRRWIQASFRQRENLRRHDVCAARASQTDDAVGKVNICAWMWWWLLKVVRVERVGC